MRKNKTKKKSCLPAVGLVGAVTALAGATAYGVTKMLVNTALDRDPPKLMQNSNNLISGSPPILNLTHLSPKRTKNSEKCPTRT